MANQLSMAKINTIQTLHQSGHSNRKIAELLGVDRGSVGKYVHQLESQSDASTSGGTAVANPHLPGPPSACEPLREVIATKLERGLSAQRIFQDLCSDHSFSGSYYSVRRFVARLQAKLPLSSAPNSSSQFRFGRLS